MFKLYLRMIAHWFSHTRLRHDKKSLEVSLSSPSRQSPRSSHHSRAHPPRPSHGVLHPPRSPPTRPISRVRFIASTVPRDDRARWRRAIGSRPPSRGGARSHRVPSSRLFIASRARTIGEIPCRSWPGERPKRRCVPSCVSRCVCASRRGGRGKSRARDDRAGRAAVGTR